MDTLRLFPFFRPCRSIRRSAMPSRMQTRAGHRRITFGQRQSHLLPRTPACGILCNTPVRAFLVKRYAGARDRFRTMQEFQSGSPSTTTKTALLPFLFTLLIVAVSCGRAINRAAERRIRDALPDTLGPARQYRVHVDNAPDRTLRGRLANVTI